MRKRIEGSITIATIALVSIGVAASLDLLGPIVINEVAWAGACWDPTAEWIELMNATTEPIELEGWRLVSSDGSPNIALRGTIPARVGGDPATGFFLLERIDDDSAPGVAADQIYRGALTDRGESLYLYDPSGNLADSANDPLPEPSAWPAGTDGRGTPPYASMERVDYRLSDDPENWASSSGERSAEGRTIRGTPRAENSVFNIPPTASFEMDPSYPLPGARIEFDASGSFDENDRIASYRWDFGDGTEAVGVTADHIYALSGEYPVVLTVIDDKGGRSELSRVVRVQATTPPVADFSLVVLPPAPVPRAGSPIRFQDESSDVDGEIASWEWLLGDGTTAEDAVVLHTYERSGEYLITLWVSDDQGERAIQTRSVTIASLVPVAVFTRSVERPNVGESVRFDASESHDPDGEVAVYRWDFDGDGTYEREATDPIVEHAFASGGDYDVGLVVVDDAGDTSSPFVEPIHVNCSPIAEFRLSTFEAGELVPIRFADLSYDEDGVVTSWAWDFGDGSTSDAVDPEYAYEEDGTYAVSLTVTDDNGARHTTTAEILISNLPPIARLSTEESIRPTGEPFRFDASASSDPSPEGSIVEYAWDLDGDGETDRTTTSPTLSHAYDDDGSRTVSVRATDDDAAATVSDPVQVTVTNRPPRITRITWTPATPTDADEVLLAVTANDADGEIVQWTWDYDDGVSVTGSGPTVRFSDDGRYTITLTVEDNDRARSDPFSVEVIVDNAPPIAVFFTTAVDGRCLTFDARDSHDQSPAGEILHVAWDFGDGVSCPGLPGSCGKGGRWSPSHCYSEPGTYIVTLVVIDEQGAVARIEKTVLVRE